MRWINYVVLDETPDFLHWFLIDDEIEVSLNLVCNKDQLTAGEITESGITYLVLGSIYLFFFFISDIRFWSPCS